MVTAGSKASSINSLQVLDGVRHQNVSRASAFRMGSTNASCRLFTRKVLVMELNRAVLAFQSAFDAVMMELRDRVQSLPVRGSNHSFCLEFQSMFARVMAELSEHVKLTTLRSALLKASFARVLLELRDRVKSLRQQRDRRRSVPLEWQSSMALLLV
jgi:hypothetical protein